MVPFSEDSNIKKIQKNQKPSGNCFDAGFLFGMFELRKEVILRQIGDLLSEIG